jgi:hypothetical protein
MTITDIFVVLLVLGLLAYPIYRHMNQPELEIDFAKIKSDLDVIEDSEELRDFASNYGVDSLVIDRLTDDEIRTELYRMYKLDNL